MHAEPINILDEKTRLDADRATTLARILFVAGLALLGLTLVLTLVLPGYATGSGEAAGQSWRTFLTSYLFGFTFWLSISLGALFFVLIQHLTKAGWSVAMRRVAEMLASPFLIYAILAVPLIVGAPTLFEWANPADPYWEALHEDTFPAGEHAHAGHGHAHGEHGHAAGAATAGDGHDHGHHHAHIELIQSKAGYLSLMGGLFGAGGPPFPGFIFRLVGGLLVLWLIARWLFARSTAQDLSGDVKETLAMEKWSAPAMFVFALCLTMFAFDLLMSLEPTWFSTIYGVWYFAGSNVAFFALASILLMSLQRFGYVTRAVTTEHYHDLGKLMFAFVVFWGYISFSQYMLIWYAAVPEETAWYFKRAADNPLAWASGWNAFSLTLLFGHLLVPITLMLSRWNKRTRTVLFVWSVWLLVFHAFDIWWQIRPTFSPRAVPFNLLPGDICALAGFGAITFAVFFWKASEHRLVPLRDPRINESLVFQNH